MHLFQAMEMLEQKEEHLREQVNLLSEKQKKKFYTLQSKTIKDPDTYAALNWLFIGGFHHYYLGKYKLFCLNFSMLIIFLLSTASGYYTVSVVIFSVLTIYELPQLFCAQKIVRQYNYDISCKIFNDLNSK